MNKVIKLVRIQLWAVMGDMLSIGKNRQKKPKALYAGIIFFIILMSGISFFYSFMFGSGLKMNHCIEILPALFISVACAVILMTTIFKVKGTIFGFRDYDMVMSLPVSSAAVVASRLILLYAINFLFVIIIVLPMMIAYGILAQPNALFYIIGFITMFFIPLVPIVLASFLGTLIAYAASKFKQSNLFGILLSLGLLAAIVCLSFTMGDSGQELVDMGKILTSQVNKIYPLAGMYTKAVVNYDMTEFLLFIGISVAAFALYTLIVKQLFKKLNTAIMTGSYHTKFRMGQLKTASPFAAMYQKELMRYFSSGVYVLNTGFGIVMLTIGAVAAAFVDLNKAIGDPQAVEMLIKSSPIYISFCVIMTCTTMASISLEGRNIWIIKSMPLTPMQVYLPKAVVNLTIIAPALPDIIIIGIFLKFGLLKTVLLLMVTVACAVFISLYGLIINLLLPNLDWTTEVIVVKQSAASMVTIFSAMGYVAVQAAFIFLLPAAAAYLAFFFLTAALDVGLFIILKTYGKKKYYLL